MRVVTMTRDLRPWRAGEDAFLPDEVAARLIESGDAKHMRPFPPGSGSEAPAHESVPDGERPRPRRYMTRRG